MMRITDLAEAERRKLEALRTNLPYFAMHFLSVLNEKGEFVPFRFNRAQMHLHAEIERMRRETGKVRVLVPKGRKVGVSTYTAARFFQKTMFRPGTNTFIMAHDGLTTKTLFELVKTFYDRLPAGIRLPIKASNARELAFDSIHSNYTVGTAGNAEVGRGTTPRLFHGSEVGFWRNAQNIAAGAMKAVPQTDDTEVILESTANGMDAFFYKNVTAALAGKGGYRVIFIPWYWHELHVAAVPDDFVPDAKERELLELYGPDGLTEAHLMFRRNTIVEFGGREWKFMQEYPCNVVEAFQTSGTPLIPAEAVVRARKRLAVNNPQLRVVFGVDKGRDGPDPDRTVICRRQGNTYGYKIYRHGMNEVALARILAELLKTTPGSLCNIDVGEGKGCYDLLRSWGYENRVNAIYFGSAASDPKLYENLRAEMACKLRDHLMKSDCSLPDDDEVHADLVAVPDYKPDLKIKLVAKAKIVEEFGQSPDIFDASCLTHAVAFHPLNDSPLPAKVMTGEHAPRRSPLSSLAR